MAADDEVQTAREREARGIDAWLRRYSRWKERRLIETAKLPLSALALRSGYLSACILLDGVFLPWIVMLLAGGFSFAPFAVSLLPIVVLEGLLYRKIKSRRTHRV